MIGHRAICQKSRQRTFPGYATEFLWYSSNAWEVRAHDLPLPLLREALGENLIWGLARCFEASDRLVSLRELIPTDSKAPVSAERNRWTAFVLGAGTMRDQASSRLCCKTIAGRRLKQSGMRWTVKGANAILALRCCELSGRTKQYWEHRAA